MSIDTNNLSLNTIEICKKRIILKYKENLPTKKKSYIDNTYYIGHSPKHDWWDVRKV